MANYIPFEKLEVGKTYYMQSRYWRKILGRATIERIELSTGTGSVFTDWNPNSKDGRGWCMINADEDFMWNEMPTEDEQKELMNNKPVYVPPRELDGVLYDGTRLDDRWIEKLDELIKNLTETFRRDNRFKTGREGSFMWASELNYRISPLLIRNNGKPDWESIRYVEHNGFHVRSGERDSFGWLTGIVEDRSSDRYIIFD